MGRQAVKFVFFNLLKKKKNSKRHPIWEVHKTQMYNNMRIVTITSDFLLLFSNMVLLHFFCFVSSWYFVGQ